MSDAAAPKPKIIDVSLEQAYEMAEELTQRSVHETPSMKVFHGQHPKHGWIYISIPPIGNPLLLPVVIQNLAL